MKTKIGRPIYFRFHANRVPFINSFFFIQNTKSPKSNRFEFNFNTFVHVCVFFYPKQCFGISKCFSASLKWNGIRCAMKTTECGWACRNMGLHSVSKCTQAQRLNGLRYTSKTSYVRICILIVWANLSECDSHIEWKIAYRRMFHKSSSPIAFHTRYDTM